MDINWVDLDGFSRYQVNRLGKVRNKIKGNILNPKKSSSPYYNVSLYEDGKNHVFTIHRLIAETFIPKVVGKNFINHIDNDPYNNHVNNLEWCTQRENIQHSIKQGRFKDNGHFLNKRKQVYKYDLQGNYISSYNSTMDIQRKYGFKSSNICRCCAKDRPTAYGYIWRYEKVEVV